jgi:hypothetical protein
MMGEQSSERRTAGNETAPARRSGLGQRRAILRWLLAGLGAGAVAKAGAGRAEAANGDPVVAGQTVTATNPTAIQGTVSGNAALRATNNFSGTPDAVADGVQGYAAAANNAGVFGRNNDLDGIGVAGVAPNGTGVFGDSLGGSGVGGKSNSGAAVRGESGSGSGVYGSTATGFAGVYGYSQNNRGVYGFSATKYGVNGKSQTSAGVIGQSDTNNGVYGYSPGHKGATGFSDSGDGIFGESGSGTGTVGLSNTSHGVWAKSTSGNGIYATSTSGRAAQFDGPVLVNGSFTVSGGPKSAAVPHPDGTHRRLYCLESPESFFEDFGQGSLAAGKAEVKLDSDFAAVVRGNDYGVFLTPEGDSKGLYVTNKRANGFEVREQQGGTSRVAFSYRVLAKRKDVDGPRLEKVTLPKPLSPDDQPQPLVDPRDPSEETPTPPAPVGR